MKKLLLSAVLLTAVVFINAQSLEDIVNKYTVANKLDKVSEITSMKITARTSVMGMDMPVEIWVKSPNKIKTVSSVNGMDIIQAFDGEKGYAINPMAGSSDPVEMTPEQAGQVASNNPLSNYMANYLKEGKLTLEGEENVNGKPAFKLKAVLAGGTTASMFIDKDSYLLVKTVADLNQGGMAMTAESYPTDYQETNGVLLPMKTTTQAGGMEIVTTYTKVEVNIPIEDSVFKIK